MKLFFFYFRISLTPFILINLLGGILCHFSLSILGRRNIFRKQTGFYYIYVHL